jgi:hypothetical protein
MSLVRQRIDARVAGAQGTAQSAVTMIDSVIRCVGSLHVIADVGGLRFAGQLRQLPDQAVHDLQVALNAFVLFPYLLLAELVLGIQQHVRGRMDHGQRRAQVMRHFREHGFKAFRHIVHRSSRSEVAEM